MRASAFALTDTERRLFGVHRGRGTLVLRPSGWVQLAAGAQTAVAGAFLLLVDRLGSGRQLLAGVVAALVVGGAGLLLWAGTVVASPDGLRVWWFGLRRIPWDRVAAIRVATHSPWWGGVWPPFAVVDATLRDGTTLTLWPTRSGTAAADPESRPSPASVHCGLLERYRATLSA